VTVLGIDYRQWKALTSAGLKTDLRADTTGGGAKSTRSARAILLQLAGHVAFGVGVAVAIFLIDDLFTGAVVAVSVIPLVVAMTILLVHHAFVTAPTDYLVIGHQPVTSATWLASKVSAVLLHALIVASACGLAPASAFLMVYGYPVGVVAFLAIYLAAITVTLAMMVLYVWIIRWVDGRRLVTILSIVQACIALLLAAAAYAAITLTSPGGLSSIALPKTSLVLLYPGTWFASYIELAAGRFGTAEALAAAVPPAALTLLVLAGSRLAPGYQARMGALSMSTTAPVVHDRPRPAVALFRWGEARAAAQLIAAHVRDDIRAKMFIFGMLPLTVFYIAIGLPGETPEGSSDLAGITFLIMFTGIMLRQSFAHSEAFKAAWILRVSPASASRIIRATNAVIWIWFIVPYLVALSATSFWLIGTPYVLELALAGVLAFQLFQIASLFQPDLPFSQPRSQALNMASLLPLTVTAGVFSGIAAFAMGRLPGDPMRMIVAFAVLGAVSIVLDWILRFRADGRAARATA
jgi:hypothetical protein